MDKHFDVVIVGGGVLGTCLAYWLSYLYEGRIAVLEMENDVARHTSRRNTGVIHRPFYLNPDRRKVFARSAQISYALWKRTAQSRGLPWQEIGTIEVATRPEEVQILEKYMKWAAQNGMTEQEIEFLDGNKVSALEPMVHCSGAVFSKTDTSVDFGLFTQAVKEDAISQGVAFLFGFKAVKVQPNDQMVKILNGSNDDAVTTSFLLNCSGGNAVDIAHSMEVGLEYTDLHFRGEYWEIESNFASNIKSNIYSVPRHPELPFLDPHWIVRADGRREIGPNAVLVSGAYTYEGFFKDLKELFGKILERPRKNKIKLFMNPDFLRLASEEWASSISRIKMVERVRKFIPDLSGKRLARRGTAGIRSSVIDQGGNFVKEALELAGLRSFHILNYNSPGATGAPAYTAVLAKKLKDQGFLDHLKLRKDPVPSVWNYQEVISQF